MLFFLGNLFGVNISYICARIGGSVASNSWLSPWTAAPQASLPWGSLWLPQFYWFSGDGKFMSGMFSFVVFNV